MLPWLPGGARLGSTQTCTSVGTQGVEVHLLEAPVGLGIATVAACEAARASDQDPVAGTIHGADELGRIDATPGDARSACASRRSDAADWRP